MRNSDGHLVLSKTVLGTIITACIAAGSGGAFVANKASAAPSDALQASVLEHVRVDEGRDAKTQAEIQALRDQLNRIEEALRRVDDKLDRMRRHP